MKKWLHGILNFIQVNVGFGFDVKAKEALNYFKSKGLKESFSYVDVFREEHASAFTVAKMMDMDLLKDVQDSLHAALAEGLSFDSWKERIVPTLQANGWWGRQAVYDPISGKTIVSELGSPHRLEVIFRTNMQMSYSVGQWQQIMAQAEEAPYLMYDAVDDYRTRPQHWAWNKTILRFDNPWWRTHYPPNGWLCFLPDVEIDGALNGGVRRIYNGKAIEIFTASGRSLKVTANHPILTRRGWVAAEMINPTDQLLAYDRPVKAIDLDGSPGQMYDQKFIPSAENLFKAMVRDAFALTESPAFQFDSNFLPVNGEVHINVVNGGLLVQSKPDTGAGVEKTLFVRGSDSSLSALHIPVSTAQGDFVAPNIVGTQDSVNVPLGAFEFDRQGSLTDFAGGVPLDNDSLTLVIVFSCGFPSSGTLPFNRFRVLFDDLPLSRFSLGLGTEDNTLFSELSSNGTSVDSGLFSYLVDTYAAQVFADPVINIRKFSFSGHVYDFQSEESILSANGIITHNCRCGVIQLSDGDLEVMGLSVSDNPRITYSNWQNPRTGINQKIPEGIDPGFDYNPGILRYNELQKVAKEKAAALPDNLRAAAEQSLKDTTKAAKKPSPAELELLDSPDSSINKNFNQPPSETFSIYDDGAPTVKPDISTPRKTAVVEYEDGIRDKDVEHGAFFGDGENSLILDGKGDTNMLAFDLTQNQLNNLKDSTFTHNHPKGGTFSVDDIVSACDMELREIRAVTGKMRHSMAFNARWINKNELRRAIDEAIPKANDTVTAMLLSDEINISNANNEVSHQVWRLIAQRFGFTYTREKS